MLYSGVSELLETALMGMGGLTPPSDATLDDILEAVTVSFEDFKKLCEGVTDVKQSMGVFYCNETLREKVIAFSSGEAPAQANSPLNDEQGESIEGGGEEEEVGAAAFDVDAVIEGLCDMFKEKNGRDPTDEEVKIWINQITGITDGSVEVGQDGEIAQASE